MVFTTLDTIVNDILKVIRGSIVSSSEPISKRQIEDWVHQYRAVLLRRNLDKGQYPNPDFIQEIPMLELEQVRVEGGGALNSLTFPYEFDFPLQAGERQEGNQYFLRTKLEIPKTIDFSHKSGFTWVGTVDGTELQMVPQHRERWQQYKKYTSNDIVWFLNGNRLYFSNSNPDLDFITVRGIFENPMEVGRFQNPVTESTVADYSTPYPIPNHLLDPLKKMILEAELNITVKAPSDTTNNSHHNLEQN